MVVVKCGTICQDDRLNGKNLTRQCMVPIRIQAGLHEDVHKCFQSRVLGSKQIKVGWHMTVVVDYPIEVVSLSQVKNIQKCRRKTGHLASPCAGRGVLPGSTPPIHVKITQLQWPHIQQGHAIERRYASVGRELWQQLRIPCIRKFHHGKNLEYTKVHVYIKLNQLKLFNRKQVVLKEGVLRKTDCR